MKTFFQNPTFFKKKQNETKKAELRMEFRKNKVRKRTYFFLITTRAPRAATAARPQKTASNVSAESVFGLLEEPFEDPLEEPGLEVPEELLESE